MADQTSTPAQKSDTITLDAKSLQDLIAGVVAQVVKQMPTLNEASLGKTIGDSVAQGIAASTRKKVSYGEYIRGAHSPFHTKSWKETPVMRRRYYQNNAWISPSTSFDEEIVLLNKITHSGRYIDRLVEVQVVGEGTAEEEVHIRFNNTRDASYELKGKAKDFVDMLRQIVAAQDQENRDADAAKQEKQERQERRSSFNTKATREAREAAAALDV